LRVEEKLYFPLQWIEMGYHVWISGWWGGGGDGFRERKRVGEK
jgi:hypothetical protein